MEDLGRIVIDVNATGGGAAGGAGGGGRMGQALGAAGQIIAGDLSRTGARSAMGIPAVGGMVSEMLAVAAKASLIGLAITVALGGVVTVAKTVAATFKFLDRAASSLTETLAEMSPSIMVARMRNELLMFTERMRMAGTASPMLAAREEALGRLERSMFRLGSVVGIIGAKFLTPIYNILADLLEAIERNMGVVQSVTRVIADFYASIGRFLLFVNPGLGMGYMGISAALNGIANSMNQVARNTNPVYQGNQPFLDDLRLMGANV